VYFVYECQCHYIGYCRPGVALMVSAFRCRARGINGKSDRPSINRFSHDKVYIIVYTARIISLVHVLQRARVITRRRSRTREINPRYSISLTINQNGNYCYAFTVKPFGFFNGIYFTYSSLLAALPRLSLRQKRQINYRCYLIFRNFSMYVRLEYQLLCNCRLCFFVCRVKWQDIINDKLPRASRKVREKDLSLSSKKIPHYRSNYFNDYLRFTTGIILYISTYDNLLERCTWWHVKSAYYKACNGFPREFPARLGLVRESRQANENDNRPVRIRSSRRAKPAPCELKRV